MSLSLTYLAAHLRNLEALLQTYRQINLNVQSVLLILGTFLMTRILEGHSLQVMLFFESLLVSLTVFSTIVIWRFQRVIEARGKDVNWWQREIIRAEQTLLPEERRFTNFKIHQSGNRLSDEKTARFLGVEEEVSWDEINELLGAENDQIRKVINAYVLRGMQFIWGVIIIVSAVAILTKV